MIPWSSSLQTHGATRVRSSDDTYTAGFIMTHVAREKRVRTFPRYTSVRACVRARLPVVEDIGELETSGTIPSLSPAHNGPPVPHIVQRLHYNAPKLPRREIHVFQTSVEVSWNGDGTPFLVDCLQQSTCINPRMLSICKFYVQARSLSVKLCL